MSRRSRIVGFGSAGLLVIAGIGCAFAFSGTLGQNLAFVLVALGLVLATSLVFYEVGLTEDRARAREDAAKRRGDAETERRSPSPAEKRRAEKPAPKEPHPPGHDGRRRLDRLRGRPRRLR